MKKNDVADLDMKLHQNDNIDVHELSYLSFSQDIATMQLCANKLDKKDFFGKSDPFLVFYRSNEDGT